jgi:hypothetical protein
LELYSIMPRRKNKSSKRSGPSANARTSSVRAPRDPFYTGPTQYKIEKPMSLVIPLRYTTSVTATAGGIVQNATPYRNVTNAANWSSFSASFAEVRILSIRVEYIPYNRYNQSLTNVIAPLYVCVDRRDSNLLTTAPQAQYFEDTRMVCPSDPWSHTMRLFGTDEAAYVDVSSAGSLLQPASIKWYGSNFTASLLLGVCMYTFMTEFRGLHD